MAASTDPLDRFVTAQAGTYDNAVAELRSGAKRSHWMWFVFPQHMALGRSETARRYGIASADEARAYLAHPVLGPRLIAAVEAALASGETDPRRLFGSPDDLKFRSCLTLFLAADPGAATLTRALARFYGGEADGATTAILLQSSPQPRREGDLTVAGLRRSESSDPSPPSPHPCPYQGLNNPTDR